MCDSGNLLSNCVTQTLPKLDVEISIQAKMADFSGVANWLLDINQPRISLARTFLQSLPLLPTNFTTMVA